MKTAIATFHRCINYGSYWQARCLLEGLAGRGLMPVLLDHRSRRVDMAEWRCALRPHLPLATPVADRPLYTRKVRRFFEAVEALARSQPVWLERPEEAEDFDLLVIGSDEVWNFRHPWYAAQPLFFGTGVPAGRRVAYAASFGNHCANGGMDAYWARQLAALDRVSVRDLNSQRLVQQATGKAPPLVLDPCLQFAPAALPAAASEAGGMVAVYGHGFGTEFAERAVAWARRRGVRLVSIGYRNDWADEQWLTAGPLEFHEFMQEARGVLTNYFHGCVFALRLHKPFACEDSVYRSIKVRDLLAGLDSHERLVSPVISQPDFDALLDAPVSPEVYEQLAVRRAASTAYLDEALAVPTAARPLPLAHAVG